MWRVHSCPQVSLLSTFKTKITDMAMLFWVHACPQLSLLSTSVIAETLHSLCRVTPIYLVTQLECWKRNSMINENVELAVVKGCVITRELRNLCSVRTIPNHVQLTTLILLDDLLDVTLVYEDRNFSQPFPNFCTLMLDSEPSRPDQTYQSNQTYHLTYLPDPPDLHAQYRQYR